MLPQVRMHIDEKFRKGVATLPFRAQSALKLIENYHCLENTSIMLTYFSTRHRTIMADRKTVRGAPIKTPVGEQDGIDFSIIELFFFAYRDFTSDPDEILADYGFGRAHHRVLHFVNRRPGLTVAELLDVLKITKQSLARVLKQLIDTDHIVQLPGPRGRRPRGHYPPAKGRAVDWAPARPQSRRIHTALGDSGLGNRASIELFLKAMVNPELRAQIDILPANPTQKRSGDDHGEH